MKAEGSVKQEHILEAAIRRFSHFGIGKTTLTEIADDLAISKPSLFYYFRDKNALISAVARKLIGEFLEGFEARLQSASSVEEGLLSLVAVKRTYFKKYFLLAMQDDSVDPSAFTPELMDIYHYAREKTLLLLSALLSRGIAQGELKPADPAKTSGILLDTLSAFEQCMKARRRLPEPEDFDTVFDKQQEVLVMLLNGLKNDTWKH